MVEEEAAQVRDLSLDVSLEKCSEWQREDPSLKYAWGNVVNSLAKRDLSQGALFPVRKNLLY